MSEVDALIQRHGQVTESYFFYGGTEELRYAVREHVYYRVSGDDLEPLAGVTSICHIIDKSHALIPWAVKMMANKLLAEAQAYKYAGEPDSNPTLIITGEQFEKLVLSAKDAHREKLEDAGNVGHIAHDWIERYIQFEIAEDEDGRLSHLSRFPADDRARRCCGAALKWMAAHNVRWIHTEKKIFSREHRYAGTMDGLCYVDSCSDPDCCKLPFQDRLTVADWKSSNYLYTEYLYQTAAYTKAWIEETGDRVTDRWIIRLGKEDGEFDPWHAEEDTLEQDWHAFYLCLQLTRQVQAITDRVKQRGQETKALAKSRKRLRQALQAQAEAQEKALAKVEKQRERLEALALECKGFKNYKGTRKPTCNDGNPCQACSGKYEQVQAGKGKHLKEAERLASQMTPTEEAAAAAVIGDTSPRFTSVLDILQSIINQAPSLEPCKQE